MKIGIIGMGVVGGNTAKVFSKAHKIFPYDKFKLPYNAPEKLNALASNSEVAFISVPTPMRPSGEIDYSAIGNSLDQLANSTQRAGRSLEDLLVVIRSTAVSGTSDSFAKKYAFRFAVNPEFLREKYALKDMKNTDRVVIGVENKKDKKILLRVYKPLFPHAKFFISDRKTAEMIKYTANAILASQIGIANEIYQICQAVGVDYNKVKEAVLHDSRIGRNIDVPGPDGDLGFGGKCFPKDLNALMYLAREFQYRPHLLEEVWRLNEKVRKNQDWLDIKGATSQNSFEPQKD